MLTTFELDECVIDALRAGASGVALNRRPLEEVLEALRVVASGDGFLGRPLRAALPLTPLSSLRRPGANRSRIGIFLGQLVFGVLGVLSMSAEYGTGTI